MIDLDAIRKRNEALRAEIDRHLPADDHMCPDGLAYIPEDIDALLAEVERLTAKLGAHHRNRIPELRCPVCTVREIVGQQGDK